MCAHTNTNILFLEGPVLAQLVKKFSAFDGKSEVQCCEILSYGSGEYNDCDVLVRDIFLFGTYLMNYITSHPRRP